MCWLRKINKSSVALVLTKLSRSTLQWHHNERNDDSTHRRLDSLLNRLFRFRTKKTPEIRITGLCEENSPVTREFPPHKRPVTWKMFQLFYHVDLSQHRILPLSQTTPASSPCQQLLLPHPLCVQSFSSDSFPLHSTLSNQILPWPWPNGASCLASPPKYPNWRQATSASAVSHLKNEIFNEISFEYVLVCHNVSQPLKCSTNGTTSICAYLNTNFWVP